MKRSLKRTLVFTFLGIILLSLLVISLIYFTNFRTAMESQVLKHLESVSKLQEERVKDEISQMYEQLSIIVNRASFRYRVREFSAVPGKEQRQRMNEVLINAVQSVENVKSILVLDTTGIVLASTDTTQIGADYSFTDFFKKGKKGKSIDNFFLDENGNPRTWMVSPIAWEGKLIGVVAIVSTLENIERIISDYTGLGQTGETVLVKATEKGDALFIAPIRFDTTAALRRVVEKKNINNATIQALSGREGLFTDVTDYDGQPVYASSRYIEETGWGLVSKIDRKEAMAPVANLRNFYLLTILIVALVVTMVVFFFAEKITRPIRELINATKRVQNKDYSCKVKVDDKSDELGILAETFNGMTESLQKTANELERRMQELETANKELEQFSYIVSHDLKAPLRGIDSLANFIIEDHWDKIGEEGKHQLMLLKERVKKMDGLISAILDYSRIGRITGEKSRIDLNVQVNEIIETLEPPDHIEVKIEKPLPVIYCETVPMTQIFQNLISNSIKYMDKPHGEVKIGCEDRDGEWLFYVADNGSGIDKKYQKKIFQLFQTLGRQTPESTGVGLAIVKKSVESMGGRVWMESEPGKGSTCYFTLPKEQNGL